MSDGRLCPPVVASAISLNVIVLIGIEILMHHAPAGVELPLLAQAAAALGLAALNGYLAGAALGWWTVLGVDVSALP